MMAIKIRTTLICLAILMAACAPKTQTPTISAEQAQQEALRQMEMAIKESMAMTTRLSRVAFPVLSINADACGDDSKWQAGFHSANSKGKDDITKTVLDNLYGVDEKITVTYTVPGGYSTRRPSRFGWFETARQNYSGEW